MLKISFSLFILGCTLLAGCGSNGPALKPFKMDIQQGNVVTSKMLLQLKPGMTKSQVRFIMGTPLIVDSFHKDRWDYFYQMRQAGKIVEQRRVILDFEKELLSKVRGDVVPQGTIGAAKDADASDLNALNAPITVEPKPKEVSVLDRLKFWKKDEKLLAKAEVKSELKQPVATAPVTAAVMAVAAVAEETGDKLAAASTEAASAEVPSIIAVPIELPSTESAAAENINNQSTNTESVNQSVATEPLKTETLPVQPTDTKTPPVITGKESMKPFKSPSQKILPTKPQLIKPMPRKPEAPSAVFNELLLQKPAPVDSQLSRPLKRLPLIPKKGEQLIFRMDKTLDLSRSLAMLPQAVQAPATSASEIITKPNAAELEPLPVEAAPSFFDKMLEKIGF
ncbi:MAG: outer membrane protein assembly factor BamE [Bdellovibrio sp.]|nr:outer membrane protein assembly factor BamE [Methylotenera sp.]